MTAWIITNDKIADPEQEEGTNFNAKGLMGPRTASDADKQRLQAGEGKSFRMLDDDGEVYYYGRQLAESDADKGYYGENEFAPLDNFGRPNAGCTEIQFDNGEKDGKGKVIWESL